MELRFANPYFLALLSTSVYLLFRHLQGRMEAKSTVLFSGLGIATTLPTTLRLRFRTITVALRIISLCLLVIAVARPQLTRAQDVIQTEGIDIALALDVSYSMSERYSGAKSRLQSAKDVLREFVGGRQNDRIGLVAFSSEAVTASPLTLEHPELLSVLDNVGHGRLREGTAIGHGIATSVNLLRESRAKSRIVILLTDGENNSGDIDPQQAAQMAQLLGIKVYTIGMGPQAPASNQQNRAANFSYTVDEETLRNISQTTGAAYFRATDRENLKQIYDLIAKMEKSPLGQQRYSKVDDLWLQTLLAALALLVMEITLSNTLLRRLP